jgi:hypothetical protein
VTRAESPKDSPPPDGTASDPRIGVTLEYQHPDNESKTRWTIPLSVTSLAQLINQAEIMSTNDENGH